MVEGIAVVGRICSEPNDDGEIDSEVVVGLTRVDSGTGVEMEATVGERYGGSLLVNRSAVVEVWLLVTVGVRVSGEVGAGKGDVQL